MHLTIRIAFLTAAVLAGLSTVEEGEPKPDLTILYLNDVEGRLDVCDCYKKMPGGLARGAALIRLLRRDDPNVIVVDSGGVVGSRPTPTLLDTLREAYASFDCAAVNLSPQDAEHLLVPAGEAARGMRLVSTNAPQELAGRGVLRHVISDVGGQKVAILGLADGEGWRDAAAALREEIGSVRKDVDLVILLSRLPLAVNRTLASEVAGVDVLIGASDADTLKAPERIGSAWLVPMGRFGQSIGRLDVCFGAEGPRITWGQVSVSADIAKDEALERMIREHYAEVAKRFETMAMNGVLAVRVPYAIEPECARCHGRAHLAWRRSRHSEAFQTLEEKERHLVPECLICHSEFYRATEMPSKAIDAQRGIECATCHGDGKAHMKDPQPGNIPRGNLEACLACHDEEHSPAFDPRAGWEKIKH